MVIIKNKKYGTEWNYPDKAQELVLINKSLKEEFKKLCKQYGINKSKLLEEFYKTILLRMREGTLNVTNAYVTMNILRAPITIPKRV